MCRFGVFELDTRALELWRRGRRCRLAPQPARVLVHLVCHAGELVTREELAGAVWSDGAHVDAEAGLNAAIRQVRRALDDDAASPRFVETLPRRGYRFIAPVRATVRSTARVPSSDRGSRLVADPAIAPGIRPADRPAAVPERIPRARRPAVAVATVLVVMAVVAGALWRRARREVDLAVASPAVPSVSASSPSPAIAPPALDAYFKGRYILRSGGADSGARAAALFERALEIDPGAVPALAGLARARLRMTAEGTLEPEVGLAMAFDEANRALAADPHLAEGWHVRAQARWLGRWDWQGADADFARALAAAPHKASIHIAYAFFRSAAGDHDGAVARLEEASRLDPLSSAVNLDSAWLFFSARRYEEAIARAERALELDPTLFTAHYCLAASYERLGRSADASRHAAAMTASVGGPRLGQRSEDRRSETTEDDREAMLRWWQQQAESDLRTFPHYDRALFALGQGDVDLAIIALQESMARRERQISQLLVDPRLATLATDTRFQALVVGIGGPDPLGLRPAD